MRALAAAVEGPLADHQLEPQRAERKHVRVVREGQVVGEHVGPHEAHDLRRQVAQPAGREWQHARVPEPAGERRAHMRTRAHMRRERDRGDASAEARTSYVTCLCERELSTVDEDDSF